MAKCRNCYKLERELSRVSVRAMNVIANHQTEIKVLEETVKALETAGNEMFLRKALPPGKRRCGRCYGVGKVLINDSTGRKVETCAGCKGLGMVNSRGDKKVLNGGRTDGKAKN